MGFNNLGEGIFAFGVFVCVGITKNYWLLFFLIFPLLCWTMRKHKESNESMFERHDLEMQKLREEIRLLKVRKK